MKRTILTTCQHTLDCWAGQQKCKVIAPFPWGPRIKAPDLVIVLLIHDPFRGIVNLSYSVGIFICLTLFNTTIQPNRLFVRGCQQNVLHVLGERLQLSKNVLSFYPDPPHKACIKCLCFCLFQISIERITNHYKPLCLQMQLK